MTITVQDLLNTPSLRLTCRTPELDLARPIRIVHTSEVLDPSPWLQGNELLLTTGLGFTNSRSIRDYVKQLADANIAGLGFGVEFKLPQAPDELVEKAQEHGIPIFEIPLDTPYIAISEQVAKAQAEEKIAEISRAAHIKNALYGLIFAEGKDTGDLLAAMNQELGSWSALLNTQGKVLTQHPARLPLDRKTLRSEAQVALGRGAHSSSVLARPGEHILFNPLGGPGQVHHILAVGKRERFSAFDLLVIADVATLISFEDDQRQRNFLSQHPLRSALARTQLNTKSTPPSPAVLQTIDLEVDQLTLVAHCHTGEYPSGLLAQHIEWSFASQDAAVASYWLNSQTLAIFAQREGASRAHLSGLLREALAQHPQDDLHAGVAFCQGLQERDKAHHRAALAMQVALREDVQLQHFQPENSFPLLAQALPVEFQQAYQQTYDEPLQQVQNICRFPVLQTVRAYLAHHGSFQLAAQELDIHRHTLIQRIRRVEELTGFDFEQPDTRAGLWLALTLAQQER